MMTAEVERLEHLVEQQDTEITETLTHLKELREHRESTAREVSEARYRLPEIIITGGASTPPVLRRCALKLPGMVCEL